LGMAFLYVNSPVSANDTVLLDCPLLTTVPVPIILLAMPNLLSTYLAEKQLSLRKFGLLCDPPIHHSLIDRYTRGHIPSPAHAFRIESASNGAIPARYWAELQEARPRRCTA
jgi:hypothetical protein